MDRLAELAGYAQSFPGMVDDDFIAAGFTPEEISSYRSQTAPQFEQFAPTGDTLAAPDYTLRERAVQGSQDILSNTFGMDPYSAGVLSRNVLGDPNSSRSNYGMGIADFTPLGAVFATQEGSRTASRGYEAEDPVQMGLGGLEVLLGVAEGVPLAGVAARPLSKAVINTVEEVFDTPFGGEVLGYLRGVRDLDADFLRGRGDPAQAQGVGADVPGRPPLTFDEVEAAMQAETPQISISETIKSKYPDVKIDLFGNPEKGYELSRIVVPKEGRSSGVGTQVMEDIIQMADAQGAKVSLTPDTEFGGTSVSRLKDFYKRFGFVENKGRNKDFSTRNTMYRNPQSEAPAKPTAAELIGGDVGFDVVRKDASSIFGEGSERVRYTDPKTGGTIEVVSRSDGSASVLELEVPEDFQGQGIGQKLQQQIMEDFPMMGGQVSSKAAATTAYRLGRRPPGKPNATLDEVFAEIDEMSSVNMVSPDMQTRFGGPTAPSLPEANTPSEAMARDILELRAAGRAGEVTDEMMAQADDQYMFANTPLPMDEASRLARASEQEYAGDYFHGSNLGFSQFDKSTRGTFLTDSPAVADSYVGKEGGTIYPALVRGGSDFPVVSGEGRFYSDIPQSALPEELEFMKYDVGSDIPLITDNIVSRAKDERLPGIIFEDISDRGPNLKQYRGETDLMAQERTEQAKMPSDVINTFDPATIRSKFARFDPEFKGLRNLSAGVGGAAVLSSIGDDAEAGTVTETVSSIKEKYPLFSDIEVRDLRDQGVQDGRRLEFTEAYDDRVDSPLIEIFDPDLQGDELEQAIIGEFLHEAPRRIPEYAGLRERLQELKTPQQLQDDMNSYLYDVENYGEDRPFEKWDEVSRKDAFIRGHAVGQWEPEYYTDEQKALIDEMMGLIRSGANK